MAGATYKAHCIVLRKTKLAEKDLVVTMLDETGCLVRAVAKGARKPGGSYAARLELFSTVDLVLARGRNLDVITAAMLEPGCTGAPLDIEQSACASALAELICTLAQEGLPHERLFSMAHVAFASIRELDAVAALAVTTSALIKALAFAGYRPSFDRCVACGAAVALDGLDGDVPFAIADGGVICPQCMRTSDSMPMRSNTLKWANALLMSRFDDVRAFGADPSVLFDVLQLVHQWTLVHVGKNLKSLQFLFTCGLFS